ncbi:MAG: hypothetical protein IIU11_02445, partial [Bacteroidales bacterium]|nr:hypothetical protein [Bacteroidales bacterium]
MKKILMIFLAVFFVLAVEKESFAQEEKVLFSVSSDFPKQVESYMGIKTTLNKELKAEVRKFTEKLEKNVISGEYVEQIVNLMNSYAAKRANPTTHMLTVIRIFNAFWDKNQTGQFKVWHDYIMHLIGRNVPLIRLNEIMNFTVNLLLYNSLEYAASKNWYLSSSSYILRVTPDLYGADEDLLTVECQNTDIRCRMKNDTSLVIYSTSGVYTPSTHEWKGKNGKVDFRRGNLSPDSIYAELPEYVIDTRSPQYSVENVTFYNRKYFQKGLKGHFEDKVVLNGTGEKARYPQFKSYATDIKIENLVDGIDYVGGYAQNGVIFSGMVSDSLGTSYSQIVFKRDGKPFITASSRAFVFGLDKLDSQKAKIEINNGQSGVRITHIGLKLKYNSKTQQLILFRGTNESEVAEFVDDYHNLYIDANQLEWKLNDTVIYFATRPAAPNNYATFKSKDYFSHAEWNEFQGPENTNWLVILRNLFYGDARSQYTSREIQQYVNAKYKLILTEVQVHQMLLKLAYKDFLEYDISERTLYNFTQKFWDWINSHNRKSDSLKAIIRKNPNFDANIHGEDKDYDNIIINSKPKPKKDSKLQSQDKAQNDELMELIENTQSIVKNYVNGIINLNNNDLYIYHVRPFDLSKSRKVKIISDSVLVVHENCDMTFNGKIQAGLVDFYGRDFQFNYDSFNIKIPKADSMSVLTVGKTPDGKHRKIDSVRSVFETIVGVLQIDAFNNKSGVNENNVYPSLTTTDTSYVYYDKLTSEKYDRDKFHMIVYPFKLDSMNFIELNGVKAKGKFVSGIFPDLEVTLNVQPDLSLGFVLPTPDGGMDLFSGKGSYHNTVTLNASGLSGDGEIRYLTAISRAKQFSFFPDSVVGICYLVDIKGVTRDEVSSTPNVHSEYPSVYSDSAMIYWMPEKDVFSALTKDTTLRVFDRKALFNGKIDLTPKNMLAQGELLYNNTGLFSDKFTLRNSTFDADSASLCNFDEKSPGDSTGHFYTDRFNAKYDLDAQYAQFVTTGDSSALVVFPQHKYRQKTDFFSCNLANNFYEFGNTLRNYDEKQITDDKEELGILRMAYNGQGDKPVLTGVEMTSDKDTMVYNAVSSSYKNEEAVINVHDPGVIEIVDSKIDPSGIITIRKNGLIDRFNNALITCKLDTLLHKIINTTVKIRDKYYYKALGGQYEYKDEYQEISYLNIDSV